MPVTRPTYGRKPGPFVTPPGAPTQKAKAASDLAQRAALDGAVVAAVVAAVATVC